MRSKKEVEIEIKAVEKEYQVTPPGHPNYGHLLTILLGLQGELID